MSSDDCYHFLNSNSCNKGLNCPFRHCNNLLNTKEIIAICPGWQSSIGCNDLKCQLRHSNYSITNNSPFTNPPLAVSETLCFFDGNGGNCKKVNCPYKHTTTISSPASPIKSVSTKAPSTKVMVKSAAPAGTATLKPKTNTTASKTILKAKEPTSPIPKKVKAEVSSDFTIKSFETIMMEKKMKQQGPTESIPPKSTPLVQSTTPLSTTTSLSPLSVSDETCLPEVKQSFKTPISSNNIQTIKKVINDVQISKTKYTFNDIDIDNELKELNELIESANN